MYIYIAHILHIHTHTHTHTYQVPVNCLGMNKQFKKFKQTTFSRFSLERRKHVKPIVSHLSTVFNSTINHHF